MQKFPVVQLLFAISSVSSQCFQMQCLSLSVDGVKTKGTLIYEYSRVFASTEQENKLAN